MAERVITNNAPRIYRGVEQRKLVWLITRRSRVRFPPPHPCVNMDLQIKLPLADTLGFCRIKSDMWLSGNAIQEGKANLQCLVTTLKNKLRVAGDSIRKEKVATFFMGD